MKSLSGGERNRLLLARLFTRPANVLVLDEPTNDLDIETLELLESRLIEFPGTVLLVSHDRTCIYHVVTSTLVFEGEGRVQEYVGGYEDWVRRRFKPAEALPTAGTEAAATPRASTAPNAGRGAAIAVRRLSYKEQRELEALPARIDALEAEERELNARVAGPEFYKEGGTAIAAALARLEALAAELSAAYARWEDLDSLAK